MYLCDLTRLVVPAEQRQPGWVPQLKTREQADSLDAVVTAVHEVPEEGEVGIGAPDGTVVECWSGVTAVPSGNTEELEDVVELAMDVTADGDGCVHREHIRLFNQDIPHSTAHQLQLQPHEIPDQLQLVEEGTSASVRSSPRCSRSM